MNLLLDVLLCSIAENFTRCLYFDSPYGLVKIRHNSYKYSAILHNKTCNKKYLFVVVLGEMQYMYLEIEVEVEMNGSN